MRLFRRKGTAIKNRHARALKTDPKKTKLILIQTNEAKQLPAWVYKKYAPQLAISKIS